MTDNQIQSIPAELRAIRQWHVYKLTPRKDGEKMNKAPADPVTGQNLAGWQKSFFSFEQTLEALLENKPGNLAGVGFVFTGEEPFSGADLDSCINDTGNLTPAARQIVERLASYTEVSPSGKGLRIIGRGKLPDGDRGGKRGDYEAYSGGRFLTITGNVFENRCKIRDFTTDLAWYRETFTRAPAQKPVVTPSSPREQPPSNPDSPQDYGCPSTPEDVIRLAELSKDGDKFRRLMSADLTDYGGDQSSADLALCSLLAFFCGKNESLMMATFEQSELAHREKWKREDYRIRTIKKAIDNCKATYDPNYSFALKNTGGGVPLAPDNPKDWPNPVILSHPKLPEIPIGSFPNWLERMIDGAATATETPRELGAGLALFVLSTACQKVYSTRMETGYFEQLSLYLLLVMDSSNRKTAVQAPFLAPIFRRQSELAKDTAGCIAAAERKIKNISAIIEGLRRQLGAKTGGKGPSRDEIMAEIEELESGMPAVPATPTLLVNDITTERLPVMMAENGERMGLIADEGGLFETMAGRYSKGVPNLDIYLQAHPGSYVRIDRGSRPPITLEHPALSLCVFGQTEVLSGLGGKPGFRGRGLLGRFLYLIPPSNLGYRKLQTSPLPESVREDYSVKLTALLDKKPAEDERGKHPHALMPSVGAFQAWKDFSHHIEVAMRPGGGLEGMTDYAGKVPGQAARIAGLLHCAEHAEGNPEAHPISYETMDRALDIMKVFLEHAQQGYGILGADPRLEDAKRVIAWIEREHLTAFTARDAFEALKGHFKTMTPLNDALEILGERYYIGDAGREGGPGRPSRRFRVNPKITGRGG